MYTKEQEAAMERLLDKFKQDPQYELKQEFGRLLLIHINDLTQQQRKRYNELRAILMPPQTKQTNEPKKIKYE